MIQMITYSGEESNLTGKDVTINPMHNPQSLDEFEINIIDLSNEKLWERDNARIGAINSINDFRSMSTMIENSSQTTIIIVMPQNSYYSYAYSDIHGAYENSCELKDMIEEMKGDSLSSLYMPLEGIPLFYESTRTKCENDTLNASFYFNYQQKEDVLTSSEKSKKATTILMGKNIILSTLQIKSYDELVSLLHAINLIDDKQDIPEWAKEVKMFDDEKQLNIIQENKALISQHQKNIDQANEALSINQRYKSVLYTTGDDLVEVVFEILENMLDCDLSEFVDEKKEDFRFELRGITFIGEIKGVNHNVKNENVSQLEVHHQRYLDEHEGKNEKNIRAILIMNHQKNKPVSKREDIHNDQINLAKKYGSLIVETTVLLKMFEGYRTKDYSQEDCLNFLINNTGKLSI